MTLLPSPVLRLTSLGILLLLGACTSTTGSGAASESPVPTLAAGAEIESARARLDSDPSDAAAWFRLGLAWQDSSGTPGILQTRALQDSALAAFDAVLAQDEDHVKALVHRGLVLEDLNRHDEALEQYQKAAALAPGDPLPLINLGSLQYFHFRETYAAKEALSAALEIAPDNPDAHFNLGVLFADANLYREAKAEWERVIEIDADGPAGKLAQENLLRILPAIEEATTE